MTMTTIITRISALVSKATALREEITWAELDEKFWLREQLQGVYDELAELQAMKEPMS